MSVYIRVLLLNDVFYLTYTSVIILVYANTRLYQLQFSKSTFKSAVGKGRVNQIFRVLHSSGKAIERGLMKMSHFFTVLKLTLNE